MNPEPAVAFSHVGLFVTDIERMVDFYSRILGLVVSDRETLPEGVEVAFLTGDSREHHQLVFATGRPADLAFNLIQQLSFRVASLPKLRALYEALTKEPVVNLGPISMATPSRPTSAIPRAIGWNCSSTRPGTCRSRSECHWSLGRPTMRSGRSSKRRLGNNRAS